MVVVINWLLGLGIIFGLAFVFNSITFDNMLGFIAYLLIFHGFVVWCGLLPSWTLILNVIILVLVMYYESTNKKGI